MSGRIVSFRPFNPSGNADSFMRKETARVNATNDFGKTGQRLAVIGTGALGSALLERLARHRCASVLLIDPDAVEERNLALSPFLRRALSEHAKAFLQGGAGGARKGPIHGGPAPIPNKAELLAWDARRSYGLPWQALPASIADVGWDDLRGVDLLCCCTDSALSRAETAFVARVLRKPMLDGAVLGNGIPEGRVSSFAANTEAACYLCGMTEERRATVLGYAASASMGCRVPEDGPPMTGTPAAVEAVVEEMLQCIFQGGTRQGGAATSSAVKLRAVAAASAALGPRPAWHREPVALPRSATCPWHGESPADLHTLSWEQPLCASAFSAGKPLAALTLQLAWPVCTDAVCRACGTRSQPLRRVARVRQASACPACGAAGLEPLRAVQHIRAGEELSFRSPRELGLPPRHLYWFRKTSIMQAFRHEDAS